MNITDLPAYQDKPRQHKPKHEIPMPVAREAGADEVIESRVWEVRETQFKLCDDPVGNWYRCRNSTELALVNGALCDGTELKVTVGGIAGKELRNIETI